MSGEPTRDASGHGNATGHGELGGQVHIVTGAGRGIGLEVARRIAARGGTPILVARHAEQIEQATAELRAAGHTAEAFVADVTDPVRTDALVKHVRATYGRIDGLVNNAASNHVANLLMSKEEEWHRIFDLNVFALFRLTKACLKPMVAAKYGRIVNLSSAAAKVGSPYNSVYSASKAAVDGFTRSLALEVARLGITVNCVSPSYVDTELLRLGMTIRGKMVGQDAETFIASVAESNPQRRLLRPGEIAATIVHLLGPEAGGVTGQSWNVCGGVAMGM
jgi:NAD(P)-dependent dehydrogenase (short-subunit alcohol dehydrogenase family)